jgi:hypothetical protein
VELCGVEVLLLLWWGGRYANLGVTRTSTVG